MSPDSALLVVILKPRAYLLGVDIEVRYNHVVEVRSWAASVEAASTASLHRASSSVIRRCRPPFQGSDISGLHV